MRLIDYGHYQGKIDGDYGPGTETAVKAFQTDYQMDPSGVVDEATWNALNLEDVIDAFEDTFGQGDGIQDRWPTADEFVDLCLSQAGDEYEQDKVEVDYNDPNPTEFDCSELVDWAVAQLGIKDQLVSSFNWSQGQRAAVNACGLDRTVEAAKFIRGALLFNSHHVAVSLGTGNETIEAKGEKWGVGQFTIDNRFDGAGLVPGVIYPEGS
jgi:peptidoglycan hydrolase-like protein with peptidoglycan-binding domain